MRRVCKRFALPPLEVLDVTSPVQGFTQHRAEMLTVPDDLANTDLPYSSNGHDYYYASLVKLNLISEPVSEVSSGPKSKHFSKFFRSPHLPGVAASS